MVCVEICLDKSVGLVAKSCLVVKTPVHLITGYTDFKSERAEFKSTESVWVEKIIRFIEVHLTENIQDDLPNISSEQITSGDAMFVSIYSCPEPCSLCRCMNTHCTI